MNEPISQGPRCTVQCGATRFTLVGTAHVSRASAEEVRAEIVGGEYDAVAVELCENRYQSLVKPEALARMDLFEVVRSGKAGMVAASLALGAYQQRLAEQFGIEPGAEMRAAIESANAQDLPILLVDRDVGVTLKRVYRSLPWWQRFGLISGLFGSLFSREKVTEEEIERLKEGDILETTFAEFAQRSGAMYETLIDERDQFMSARLREEAEANGYRHVLVVIGAGHLKGLAAYLERGEPREVPAALNALSIVPPGARWPRMIPWIVIGLVLIGFLIGFSRGVDVGFQLIGDWVLINGTLAALGALLAFAHPVTVVGSFAAAPITSLNPTVGAGVVAAAIEIALRRPQVGDFADLRHDVTRLSGWWRNRVARTLLVFIFVTAGSSVGTYVAGFRIFERLIN
ncbi:TraB/GumN family protein [Ectothiorhodospiraceae bacterium 2226]|nr:TraB/GumN family protein [Ectothiorhodospiraceae bacterium 2226]